LKKRRKHYITLVLFCFTSYLFNYLIYLSFFEGSPFFLFLYSNALIFFSFYSYFFMLISELPSS
jgi:hypothetical protein